MRYHFDKPGVYLPQYGKTYRCDHPVYNTCTLFRIKDRGLAVIQQRFNTEFKSTFWDSIDPWLTTPLYTNPRFKGYFDKMSGIEKDGLYPTVTVRQIMWALRMKPLKREPWETSFDRKPI